MPLVSLVIIVINVIIDDGFHLLKGLGCYNLFFDVIFHVTKEAFLWRIVPTVTSPRHGLPQLFVMKDFDETMTGVMAALIRMYNGFSMKGDAMVVNQLIHGF